MLYEVDIKIWAQDSLEVGLLLGRRPRDKYFHRQVTVQEQGGS